MPLCSAAALILLLVSSWLLFSGPRQAAAGKGAFSAGASAGKVVLIIIDRIGIDDIADRPSGLPNINRLISQGSLSLMNTRIRYMPYGPGGYLVLGAGGRVLGGENAALSYGEGELLRSQGGGYFKAGDIFRSRTGRKAPRGSIVNLSIEEIKEKSESYLTTSTPGLLGSTLKTGGKKVAVVGNADSLSPTAFSDGGPGDEFLEVPSALFDPQAGAYPMTTVTDRSVACVAMTGDGLVPGGDVSSRLSRRSDDGSDLSTDFKALTAEARHWIDSSDVTVVDMGETTRVDRQAEFFSEEQLARERASALDSCDRALGEIVKHVNLDSDLVLVCSPTPTREMIRDGDPLTPLIIAGPGFMAGSTLRSSTVRRPGLVSNLDIAPTVLRFMGMEIPEEMEGNAVEPVANSGIESLVSLKERSVYAAGTRASMINVFVFPATAVLLLLILIFLLRPELATDHSLFWSVVLLSLLSAPLAYLLVPLLPLSNIVWSIPAALGAQLVFGAGSLLLFLYTGRRGYATDISDSTARGGWSPADFGRAAPRAALLILGLTLFAVSLDSFLGSVMISRSPFGSILVMGARYYGIGNIYAGAAIGAAILVACFLPEVFDSFFDRAWKSVLAATLVLAITVSVLGYPRLGANVGGLITGLTASLVVIIKLRDRKIGPRQVLLIALIVLMFLVLFLVVDLLLPGTSHAGRALSRISERGLGDAAAVIARKTYVNLRLVTRSNWRFFLLAGLAAALVWVWKPGIFKSVGESHPTRRTAWLGILTAMVVGLLFNDTGIEIAGILVLYLLMPTLVLYLSHRGDGTGSSRLDEGSVVAPGQAL